MMRERELGIGLRLEPEAAAESGAERRPRWASDGRQSSRDTAAEKRSEEAGSEDGPKAAAKAATKAAKAQTQPQRPLAERGLRKVREGLVVSDKMDKTVVVEVEDRVKHPLYGKIMRRTSKVKAHDEQNAAGIGTGSCIMETRPLSATKRWRIVEIAREGQVGSPSAGSACRPGPAVP